MSTASTIKSLAAYDLIRDMILSGEALPGTRLVLVDLEKSSAWGAAPSVMPSCAWTNPVWSRTSPTRGPSS